MRVEIILISLAEIKPKEIHKILHNNVEAQLFKMIESHLKISFQKMHQ